MANYPEWQLKMLALSVVYLTVEKNYTFPVVSSKYSDILQTTLTQMYGQDLLEISDNKYIVTEKGKKILTMSIGVVDVVRQFDVFSSVVPRILTKEEWLSEEDPAFVRWDIYDPRFNKDAQDETGKDMRLAVLTWVSEKLKSDPNLKGMNINPYEVVFMFKLGSGEFSGPNFYKRIIDGSVFKEVEDTVNNSFQWIDIDPDRDEETANRNMQTLYTVGMLESRKRDAPPCGDCETPLYLFEEEARQNNSKLKSCPTCGKKFGPPPSDIQMFSCPKCSYTIYDGDKSCGGCGSLIDLSLPIGSLQTDTIIETEEVYSSSYGYVSYGWVDPYDVVLSAGCFSLLCFDVWNPYYPVW